MPLGVWIDRIYPQNPEYRDTQTLWTCFCGGWRCLLWDLVLHGWKPHFLEFFQIQAIHNLWSMDKVESLRIAYALENCYFDPRHGVAATWCTLSPTQATKWHCGSPDSNSSYQFQNMRHRAPIWSFASCPRSFRSLFGLESSNGQISFPFLLGSARPSDPFVPACTHSLQVHHAFLYCSLRILPSGLHSSGLKPTRSHSPKALPNVCHGSPFRSWDWCWLA